MMRLRRPEAGASAVEAAIVTPVILMMMLGILELGFFFKDSLSASEAAKAGVRMASAQPRNANYAQSAVDRVQATSGALAKGDIEQLWVYKANTSDNFPAGFSSFSTCSTCVRYSWSGSAFVPTYSGWPATMQNACPSGPPDRIGVYLQVRHTGFTSLVFDTVTIRQADVLRFEPVSTTSGCSP